jgi:tetratricopeptide (TPR) repeat protein
MINNYKIRLKMKKLSFSRVILGAIVAVLFSTQAIAQDGKYGQDSATCVQNISIYREFYKQRNYKDATPSWRECFLNCPASTEYIYVDGVTLVKVMLQGEKDKAKFNALLDTLMMVYDKRIEHFGKEGYVLGRKGFDMSKLMPHKTQEAFNTLQKSYDLQGNKMEAPSVDAYFMMALELVKQNKMTKEEALEIYERASDVVEANKNAPEDDGYKQAQENIDSRIVDIADCALLVNIYGPKFKANQTDVALLKKITKMLDKRECASESLYLEAAVALDKVEPSADSKGKIAKMNLVKNNYSEAAKFYSQAIDLESDPTQKAQYYYELSLVNLKSGQNSSARANALKAIALRPNWGKPYIIIGDAYVSSAKDCGENEFEQKAVYWIAVDKYNQAKSVDPSVANDASQRVSTYTKHFPEKSLAFFHGYTEGAAYNVGCWIGESTKVRTN